MNESPVHTDTRDLLAEHEALLERVCMAAAGVEDAVVCGVAAAKLTFWPALASPDQVEISSTSRLRSNPGVLYVRRRIPAPLRRRLGGLTVTSRPLTALDLVDEFGGDAIDEALRTGARLSELWGAYRMLKRRHGNRLRRRILVESRDRPWSPAERAAHKLLHQAGIEGWVANAPVARQSGYAFLDIAFPQLKLGFEIDGFSAHRAFKRFVGDRDRDTELAAQGWQIVRFSASLVKNDPERFIRRVCQILRLRAALLGVPDPVAA